MNSSTNNNGETGMKKFMFDGHDFDKKAPTEPPPPMFSEAQLAAAKGESYAQGKNDGVRETRDAQEEKIIEILQKIDVHAQRLVADEDRRDIEMMLEQCRENREPGAEDGGDRQPADRQGPAEQAGFPILGLRKRQRSRVLRLLPGICGSRRHARSCLRQQHLRDRLRRHCQLRLWTVPATGG